MFYNLETSKQPNARPTAQSVSQQGIDIFYKNEESFSGATINIPDGTPRVRPYVFNDMWPENGFSVVVPDSVHTIMDYAFANTDCRKVYMSANVKTIPTHAFEDCNIEVLYLHRTTSTAGYPWSTTEEDKSFSIVFVD